MTTPFLNLLAGQEARTAHPDRTQVESDDTDELVFHRLPDKLEAVSLCVKPTSDDIINSRIHYLMHTDLVRHFSHWLVQ